MEKCLVSSHYPSVTLLWWLMVATYFIHLDPVHPSIREEQRRAQCKRLKAAVAAALLFLLSLLSSCAPSSAFLAH
jgi:hypothetical protein